MSVGHPHAGPAPERPRRARGLRGAALTAAAQRVALASRPRGAAGAARERAGRASGARRERAGSASGTRRERSRERAGSAPGARRERSRERAGSAPGAGSGAAAPSWVAGGCGEVVTCTSMAPTSPEGSKITLEKRSPN
ncbi:uncharacterized protein LOC135294061 isoform X2 [Passer domesticus]|uniref:uncharacterized protein LOC135294061 isoform X2 n=1 Tax=Passer domesticus TaxID=48849 RepID=UPI0030FE422C